MQADEENEKKEEEEEVDEKMLDIRTGDLDAVPLLPADDSSLPSVRPVSVLLLCCS